MTSFGNLMWVNWKKSKSQPSEMEELAYLCGVSLRGLQLNGCCAAIPTHSQVGLFLMAHEILDFTES
ncbi:hypothetical protein PAECIP111891_00083 [Paenibacillus allorhizoplanae]|uniref:Uncharacterized protein n=1 Tax=Paenibacillus allorhizoplanae TaxID=2905648 RepID=A0ABN8G0W5_9BACL|nr:hypothetical protein PAECIP111891_00083 [Paenibacillus allorhizoplanae]